MFEHVRTTILLCLYGAVKEFRPTEPYMYEYEHIDLNITEQQLNQQIYPVWTYSYLVTLVPAFLLTDVLLYKGVIVFEAFSYVLAWIMFVFGRNVLSMQLLELFYGWATATEIAYFAYIYVKVPKKHFKSATAFTRAALLLGRFTAYALAQLLIGLNWCDYMTLNIISLVAMVLAFGIAMVLPTVDWRQAYIRKIHEPIPDETLKDSKYVDFLKLSFRTIHHNLYEIYTDPFIIKWSMWWALANCIFLQITNYTQTLWGTLDDNRFNGITEAIVPLVGIPADLLTQKLSIDWKKYGEIVLAIVSFIQAGLLIWMSYSQCIWILYVCYIFYRLLYQTAMTIAQCNLASRLKSDSYGLLFGINTFLALILQSLLTIFVINVAQLTIRPQFVVYSIYHVAVGTIFIITFLIIIIARYRKQ